MIAAAQPLRVGIIGGGFMGLVHARAARAAGAVVLGVASRAAAGAERASERLGLDHAYASVDELLADDRIDLVHVCTPNTSHAAITSRVLSAGKHVICEKPLATSAQEAAKLADQAVASGLVAAVPFIYRFYPMVREARSRMLGGTTGRLFSIHGAYLQDWLADPEEDDWRVDPAHGGPSRAFADIGSHLCDLIEFVTGDRITRLCARLRTVHGDRASHRDVSTEDVAVVLFETSAGVPGTLHVSQVAAGHKNGLTIDLSGAHESLRFAQETPDTLDIGTTGGSTSVPRSMNLSPEAIRYCNLPPGHPQGYQDAFNAFVADAYDTSRGELRPGLPTFIDGRRAAELTQAVLLSDRKGAWVETMPDASGEDDVDGGAPGRPLAQSH